MRSVEIQRGASSGSRGAGGAEVGDAHLVALEDIALEGKRHGGGDEVVGVIAGDDEEFGVGVGRDWAAWRWWGRSCR